MEDLVGYHSEDDEAPNCETKTLTPLANINTSYVPLAEFGESINSAPKSLSVSKFQQQLLVPQTSKNSSLSLALIENSPIQSLMFPVLGPAHPYKQPGTGKSLGSFGSIEATSMEEWSFNQQYQSYQAHGYALDLSNNSILGDKEAFKQNNCLTETDRKKRLRSEKKDQTSLISSNLLDSDQSEEEEEEEGPWAKMPTLKSASVSQTDLLVKEKEKEGKKKDKRLHGEEEKEGSAGGAGGGSSSPVLSGEGFGNLCIHEPDEEDEKWQRVNERKIGYSLPPRPPRGSTPSPSASYFHAESTSDYQGRSWMTAPSGFRPRDSECYSHYGEEGLSPASCFVPKKCVKTFSGHSKGVQCIEFFPCTGHLLFSASMDGRAKVWDISVSSPNPETVSEDRGGGAGCLRTYVGHLEAIRSLSVSGDGTTFLTSGFDRYIRHWDTETGQPISTLTNRQMHYQVLFLPSPSSAPAGSPSPPTFLSAGSDNKIHQWDTRSGKVELIYNYHLQPVNALCFFDDGRKFISTSDDKKVLVWELDTPVPIKYIQEPEMHAIPYLGAHPSGRWICGQSLDNSIVTYTSTEKVRQMRKKTFRGHSNAGYCPQLGFSPNGQFLVSGDGSGKLLIWDWKTQRVYRKLQAHSGGPCVGARWHPHPSHNSWVATCGWDGLIKIWD